MTWLRLARASAVLELQQLQRNRVFVAFTVLAAISFLALVSLFGLTGSYAPMALIDEDQGPYAQRFIQALAGAHHSFALRPMAAGDAEAQLREGRLVGTITIPANFGSEVARGNTVPIEVKVDNVNIDLTNDVQRALPAAIVAFGRSLELPGVRVELVEHDVLAHDTGYVPYLVVSGLALAALVVAGALGALAVAREWEGRTVRLWRLAPPGPGALLAGKLFAAGALAALALALTVLVVIAGYGIVPVAPMAMVGSLASCIVIFGCLGAWLGAVLRRTMPVVPLLFGLAMPLYIDSGALEPTRFDGEPIWLIAHASPLYYAIGVLQWAFHGLRVTPEPVLVDLLVLMAMAGASLLAARAALSGRRW